MSLMSVIVKNIAYPMWMLKDGKMGIYSYIRQYNHFNDLSPEELQVRQLENLKNIIIHAYRNTNYYKNVYRKAGFEPSDLKSVNDMVKLPLVTKEEIRDKSDQMLATTFAVSELTKDSTGGSTGVPMIFYRDNKCWEKRRAQELFFDRWIGCEIGTKVAYFVAGTHHPVGLSSVKASIRNATRDRMIAFDPRQITDSYMEEFLLRFRKYRPNVIKCFPNSLYIFAEYLRRKGVDDLKVDVISCTGESLYLYQRQLFEEIFKCKVYEKYGTRECGVIASECHLHEGMHIFSDGVYVEVLNNGRPVRPGEMGEIVVTDLFNYGMPLIRYKIGDVAVATDRTCSCGSHLPLIDKLLGRDRDILLSEDGSPKPGYLFVEIMNKNNIPAKCQFIQEDVLTLVINIVKLNGFQEQHLHIIEDKCRSILGPTVQIVFCFKNDIVREHSGKFKYVSSKVSTFAHCHR
jgi:phenylacetate-CoA ligase